MYAPLVSSLLTPVALVAYMLACWRLGADLNVTGEFFISQGVFSRWQVWLALAIITQLGAKELNRRVGSNDSTI
jgi:acyl-coenzyme A synthetase/AMP-(fatty) acid ligase